MKQMHGLIAVALLAMANGSVIAGNEPKVKITADLAAVEVKHNGEPIIIARIQDKDHQVPRAYTKTSRACPPFCIQPMHLAPNVETVGELEVIEALKQIADGDETLLVIDSRTPGWSQRGTIPGSISVPWNKINVEMQGTFETAAEAESVHDILETIFGAKQTDDGWDFSNAKTLVLFCNGLWCPQSAANIKTLLKMGYPAEKLKWYRGGMQDWVSLGLTTVKP